METSAKTATNVDTAFTKTAELILNQIEQGHIDATNEVKRIIRRGLGLKCDRQSE